MTIIKKYLPLLVICVCVLLAQSKINEAFERGLPDVNVTVHVPEIANLKLVEVNTDTDTDPKFPWLFPSPCGLESVECDSGSLETDLEAALAASIICNHKQQQQTCTVTEEGEHTHSEPVCVQEGEKVVEAALAANAYLLGLSAEERVEEGRLADYLSYALGGAAQNYPLSNELLRDMGY